MDDDSRVEAQATVQTEQSFSAVMTQKISQFKQYFSDIERNHMLDEEYWPEYVRVLEKLRDCLDLLDQRRNIASSSNEQPPDDRRSEVLQNDETALKYVDYCNKLIAQLYNVQRDCIDAYSKTLGCQSSFYLDDEDDITIDDYDYHQNPYYRSDCDEVIGPFDSSVTQGWTGKRHHHDARVCNGKYDFDELKYVNVLASFNDRISQFLNSLREECGHKLGEVDVESQRKEDIQVHYVSFSI